MVDPVLVAGAMGLGGSKIGEILEGVMERFLPRGEVDGIDTCVGRLVDVFVRSSIPA